VVVKLSPNNTHVYGAKTTAKNTEKSAEKPKQSFEKIIEKKYANIREITICYLRNKNKETKN